MVFINTSYQNLTRYAIHNRESPQTQTLSISIDKQLSILSTKSSSIRVSQFCHGGTVMELFFNLNKVMALIA